MTSLRSIQYAHEGIRTAIDFEIQEETDNRFIDWDNVQADRHVGITPKRPRGQRPRNVESTDSENCSDHATYGVSQTGSHHPITTHPTDDPELNRSTNHPFVAFAPNLL